MRRSCSGGRRGSSWPGLGGLARHGVQLAGEVGDGEPSWAGRQGEHRGQGGAEPSGEVSCRVRTGRRPGRASRLHPGTHRRCPSAPEAAVGALLRCWGAGQAEASGVNSTTMPVDSSGAFDATGVDSRSPPYATKAHPVEADTGLPARAIRPAGGPRTWRVSQTPAGPRRRGPARRRAAATEVLIGQLLRSPRMTRGQRTHR